ncbi:MAG: AmmeMemoRadiSam system protein B [Candidatus Margulisiibacteriota bacterium]|jgi:hypothetical protein
MLRKPVFAGRFYPAEKQILQQELSAYINEAPKLASNVRAIIAPHAGYIYSGPVAGYSYKQLTGEDYDVVFVLAPSHQVWGEASSIYASGDLLTPLGEIKVEQKLAQKLIAYDPRIADIPSFHQQEHSLEVQLPFLQYLFGEKLRIVPIVMSGGLDNTKILAEAISSCARDLKYLVVASSDLSHFHDYETARAKDLPLLEAISQMDLKKVMANCLTKEWEMCGQLPVITTMRIAQENSWTEAIFLKYANSGDTAGDKSRVVGYGAVSFSSAR